MDPFKTIRTLFWLDKLILQNKTGSAEQLSEKIGIARSSVFNYLELMRAYGADIEFCKKENSYVYIEGKCPNFPFAPNNLYGKTGGGFTDYDYESLLTIDSVEQILNRNNPQMPYTYC